MLIFWNFSPSCIKYDICAGIFTVVGKDIVKVWIQDKKPKFIGCDGEWQAATGAPQDSCRGVPNSSPQISIKTLYQIIDAHDTASFTTKTATARTLYIPDIKLQKPSRGGSVSDIVFHDRYALRSHLFSSICLSLVPAAAHVPWLQRPGARFH